MPAMGDSRPPLAKALFNRRMLICIFTGFSSGLPLYILINLLPAWLRTEHVDLRAIGLFALIELPFTWKFLWSPLVDRYALPLLGRRRGWMLVTQVALIASLPLFGALPPQQDLWTIAYLAATVAFFAATQDIVLDAYRRELLPDVELGLGNAIHVQAYRISSLVPGALSLILADRLPWQSVFFITALFMLPGIVNTLLIDEPALSRAAPRTLREAVVEPFHEFIGRSGLAAGAARARLHFSLQARRQHGDRAGDAVLSRHGFHDIGHRRDRQERRAVGERNRVACSAACG